MKLYESEKENIAAKIKQRRLQMLVHSYIYYELNDNLISDEQWSRWATELMELQNDYPDISKKVKYSRMFEDWDASTGFHLRFDEWTRNKAKYLLSLRDQGGKQRGEKRNAAKRKKVVSADEKR